MKTIWKFPLEVTDEQVLMVPKGAKLLTVQKQDGKPCLWCEVDSAQDVAYHLYSWDRPHSHRWGALYRNLPDDGRGPNLACVCSL